MLHRRNRQGGIGGQFGGAKEGCLSAVLDGYLLDLDIICGHNGVRQQRAGECRGDGIGQKGLATQKADILTRPSLGAAPCRDDTEHRHFRPNHRLEPPPSYR